MPALPKSLASRIASKIVVDPITDCHNWQGAHCSQGKYPIVSAGGGQNKPPLYVHQIAAGPEPACLPPDGSHRWEVHHWCLNRSCVNPQHVTWLTHRQHATAHVDLRRALKAAAREIA
jgi:hypothetical protein